MVQFIEYEKTNREKKMTAKKGHLRWCHRCDRNLIGDLGKCQVCGFIEHKNKKKGI